MHEYCDFLKSITLIKHYSIGKFPLILFSKLASLLLKFLPFHMNLRATLLSFIKDHCCNFAFFLIGYTLREEGKQNTLLIPDLLTQKSRNLTEVGSYQHTALTQWLWKGVQLWMWQNPKNTNFLLHFHSFILEDVLTCHGSRALSGQYLLTLSVGRFGIWKQPNGKHSWSFYLPSVCWH